MAARREYANKKVLNVMIKEVKKRSCLWNVNSKFYNNRSKVTQAWCDISEKLNIPEDVLRAKWKNLRDQLKKEYKKFNVKDPESYTGKWRHFKKLIFLHDATKYTSSEDETNNGTEKKRTQHLNINELTDLEIEEHREDINENHNFLETEYLEIREPFSEQAPNDFDMMFLKSLTPFFHELEPLRKLRVRNLIQETIFNEIEAKKTQKKLNVK